MPLILKNIIMSIEKKELNIGVTGGEIKKSRENTRSWIAKAITLMFALVIVVMFCFVYQNKELENFNIVISSLSGLVGVILGFYFGKEVE